MEISQLKWQCRRGTQELDRLLIRYLETQYAHAPLLEQQQFQQFLALEDSQLLQLLFSDQHENQSEFTHLVEKIHHSTHF